LEFTGENKRAFDELVTRYHDRRAAMLPALWLVQRQEGYVSAEAMEYVAGLLGVAPGDVQAVVSFYTMYDRRPPGRYKLQICRTLSCALMGAYDVLRHLEERLGVHDGQTTADGMFTLQEVECLGSCGTGPMMQVNDRYCENLTVARVDALLDRLAREKPDLGREPEIYPLAEAQAATPRQVRSPHVPPSAMGIPLETLAPAHGGAVRDLADPRVGGLATPSPNGEG
jgi:NADH-quinone oxidoreductase subunit E